MVHRWLETMACGRFLPVLAQWPGVRPKGDTPNFITRLMSFLHNTLSEVNFRGRAGVKPGGSGRCGPVVDDTDDLIDGERDDAEH